MCPIDCQGRSSGARRARGLTLVEVLVALAIVAVTLSAGIKAAGALTGNAQRLVDVTSAQWCAENQLTEVKLSKSFPSIGESDSACEQLGRSYRVHVVVRPTPNPNFRRVDVQMADEGGQPVLSIATVIPRS